MIKKMIGPHPRVGLNSRGWGVMIVRLPGTTFDSAEGGQTTSFHRRRFNVGGVGVRPQVGIQIHCYVRVQM